MRVIAGALKGRRLRVPSWDGLRPTADKLRETLFNILAPRIAGATTPLAGVAQSLACPMRNRRPTASRAERARILHAFEQHTSCRR